LSFEFDYRVSNERLRIKEIYRSNHSMNQEWHLALGMPSSEMAHIGRERERIHLQNNIKAKAEQLKFSKTDPLKWS
jgi:hypothetical protein